MGGGSENTAFVTPNPNPSRLPVWPASESSVPPGQDKDNATLYQCDCVCLGPGKSRCPINASVVVLRTSHGAWAFITRRGMTGNVRKTQPSSCGASLDNKRGDVKHTVWFCLRTSGVQTHSILITNKGGERGEVREWGRGEITCPQCHVASEGLGRVQVHGGCLTPEPAGNPPLTLLLKTPTPLVGFCRWLPHSLVNWRRVPNLRTWSYMVSHFRMFHICSNPHLPKWTVSSWSLTYSTYNIQQIWGTMQTSKNAWWVGWNVQQRAASENTVSPVCRETRPG